MAVQNSANGSAVSRRLPVSVSGRLGGAGEGEPPKRWPGSPSRRKLSNDTGTLRGGLVRSRPPPRPAAGAAVGGRSNPTEFWAEHDGGVS